MDQIINVITHNVWVLIPLAALTIPIFGMLTGLWSSWLKYRYRREALETIKAYAAQGKEPPEAVIAALTRTPKLDPDYGSQGQQWESWGEDEDDRGHSRMERRMRRRYRSLAGRWTGFAWCAAVSVGFYLAHIYAGRGEGYLIVSIIMACIAGASLLSAIIATIFREK